MYMEKEGGGNYGWASILILISSIYVLLGEGGGGRGAEGEGENLRSRLENPFFGGIGRRVLIENVCSLRKIFPLDICRSSLSEELYCVESLIDLKPKH